MVRPIHGPCDSDTDYPFWTVDSSVSVRRMELGSHPTFSRALLHARTIFTPGLTTRDPFRQSYRVAQKLQDEVLTMSTDLSSVRVVQSSNCYGFACLQGFSVRSRPVMQFESHLGHERLPHPRRFCSDALTKLVVSWLWRLVCGLWRPRSVLRCVGSGSRPLTGGLSPAGSGFRRWPRRGPQNVARS